MFNKVLTKHKFTIARCKGVITANLELELPVFFSEVRQELKFLSSIASISLLKNPKLTMDNKFRVILSCKITF